MGDEPGGDTNPEGGDATHREVAVCPVLVRLVAG